MFLVEIIKVFRLLKLFVANITILEEVKKKTTHKKIKTKGNTAFLKLDVSIKNTVCLCTLIQDSSKNKFWQKNHVKISRYKLQ